MDIISYIVFLAVCFQWKWFAKEVAKFANLVKFYMNEENVKKSEKT